MAFSIYLGKLGKIKMSKEERYIVSTNKGGIANRLKCLISLLRFSEKYGRKLYLHWALNHTCGARFSDLFENEIDQMNEEQIKTIKNRDIDVFGDDYLTIKDSSRKYIVSGTWRLLLTEEELRNNPFLNKKRAHHEKGVDFNFLDIPELVKIDIINHLKMLKPIKIIQREINKFLKKYNLKELIGVHIRRGDFADRNVSPGRVSSDEKFIERMKELITLNPKTKFFLCTDSKEIEDKFEKEFYGRIIKYAKSSFSRTDAKATQEGLIDLMLLSKTKHILGTYRSTFTEMAWWFGECKPQIEMIIDAKKEIEFLKNTENEKRRIIPKIKRIILKLIGRRFL